MSFEEEEEEPGGGGDWKNLRDLKKGLLWVVVDVLRKLKRSDFGLEFWVREMEKKEEEEAFMAMVADDSMTEKEREREILEVRVKVR